MIRPSIRKLVPEFAPGLPAAFVESIIERESGGDPSLENPSSHAAGLMQITAGVLEDYNAMHGKKVEPSELFTPAVNLLVGGWMLRRIVATYAEQGGALTPDWTPRWVSLVALGYNAGWTRKGGVPLVVAELEQRGAPAGAIDVPAVREQARRMPQPSLRFLREPGRSRYATDVSAIYAENRHDAVLGGASVFDPITKKVEAAARDEVRKQSAIARVAVEKAAREEVGKKLAPVVPMIALFGVATVGVVALTHRNKHHRRRAAA